MRDVEGRDSQACKPLIPFAFVTLRESYVIEIIGDTGREILLESGVNILGTARGRKERLLSISAAW